MGIFVDIEKCNGCGLCKEICPGDLMDVDENTNKAYIREQRDCWDCMSCVKICPLSALQTKLPFVLADYGAKLIPKVTDEYIEWTLVDPDGNEESFRIKRKEV